MKRTSTWCGGCSWRRRSLPRQRVRRRIRLCSLLLRQGCAPCYTDRPTNFSAMRGSADTLRATEPRRVPTGGGTFFFFLHFFIVDKINTKKACAPTESFKTYLHIYIYYVYIFFLYLYIYFSAIMREFPSGIVCIVWMAPSN